MGFLNVFQHHEEGRPLQTLANGKIWLDFLIHVENVGDVKSLEDELALSFPTFRIEGFQINSALPDLDFKYMAHVQDEGDTQWKKQGEYVGTRGKAKRLEGIAVRLEGNAAANYNVRYYVLMDGVARSPIKSNGQYAGTRSESRRVEGIAVWLEPKVPEVEEFIEYKQAEPEIERTYHEKCRIPSDIHEHLPTLYNYAKQCTQIAEFGVRSVVSTWALLRGLRDNNNNNANKKLLSVDLERSPNIDAAIAAAQASNITLEFITANDLAVNLKDGVDLLFIDTWHIYPQLKLELEIHSPNVRKYIAMHDTTVDGDHGESVRLGMNVAQQARESGYSEADIRTGLKKAIHEFIETHHDWKIREVFTNCNGLTILERIAPAANSQSFAPVSLTKNYTTTSTTSSTSSPFHTSTPQ